MSSLANATGKFHLDLRRTGPLIALGVGLLVLYAPIYMDFAKGPWREDENAHALIIMAIAIGAGGIRLFTEEFPLTRTTREQLAGFSLLAVGLALIVLGSAGETVLFLSASQFFVSSGAIIALLGWRGVKRLWFPLALTLYLIIWPGWALDALTAPLKMFVSKVVAEGLYAAGLPVAYAGAVISAGPYQLLVAAACSGLNSLIALTAVGAVYLYAAKHNDWRINAVVLASLIPIAIVANILRVMTLTLITYYLGYDAGQGFMHEGAGLLMFAAALGLVFLIDGLALIAFVRRRSA
ncbi:MAG: exosortase [Pseudomonadota bacterium]